MASKDSSTQEDGDMLDILGLKALKLMQDIVKLKMELQEHMKVGSINLAKSRYIMGNRNVSSSQLPTEDSTPFRSLCTVERSTSMRNGIEAPSFVLQVHEPQKKQMAEKKNELQDCINNSCSSNDPLHWFGVLVPQNLRVAQEAFKKAIHLSIEVANLQALLEATRIEFCTLKLGQMNLG